MHLRNKFFGMREVRLQNRLPMEVGDAPSLKEVFEARQNEVLSN